MDQTTTSALLAICRGCRADIFDGTDLYSANEGSWCRACFHDRFFICHECNATFSQHDNYADEWCRECYQTTQQINPRHYSVFDHANHQSEEGGTIITSPRKFAVEIECQYENTSEANKAVRELPRTFGVEGDASIDGNGIEFQTPKLKGKKGEETLIAACKVLNAHDFTVDNSCGLHVHLDAGDFLPKRRNATAPELTRLWQFYASIDHIILTFLPESRRSNSFCMPFSSKICPVSSKPLTLKKLEELWYKTTDAKAIKTYKGFKHGSRYYGVNLHSLLANGHIEIRYHSGTLNATKMLYWIQLHQAILDYCKNNLPAAILTAQELFDTLGLPADAQRYWSRRQVQLHSEVSDEL